MPGTSLEAYAIVCDSKYHTPGIRIQTESNMGSLSMLDHVDHRLLRDVE
nr:hypothetical protein [Rugosibacter aromaticivorans]